MCNRHLKCKTVDSVIGDKSTEGTDLTLLIFSVRDYKILIEKRR